MLTLAGFFGVVAFALGSFSRGLYNSSLDDLIESRDTDKEKESYRQKFFQKGLIANTALAGSIFFAAWAGAIVSQERTAAAESVQTEVVTKE